MSLLPNRKDFNAATGGLSPRGWAKLLIAITLLFIILSVIILFMQDFDNTAEAYYNAALSSNNTYVDSKGKFRKQYEAIIQAEVDEKTKTDSTTGGSSYDLSNLTWAGKPIEFFIIQLAGEWGTGHFGQKWTDGVPDAYQVPWCCNVGWNKSPKDVTTGDGGIGPAQATYTVRGWLQQLLTIDSNYWAPISKWANDPSIERSDGKIIGYIEELDKTMMELAKKDYHKYMDETFKAWFDHVDGGRPIIETIKAEVRKNGVELDDLPIYTQAVIWAAVIRDGPYRLSNMFSATNPDEIVKQVTTWINSKYPAGRWPEMQELAFAIRDGKVNAYTGEGLAGVWKHHGDPGLKWWYENYAKGNTLTGSSTGSTTGSGIQTGQGTGSSGTSTAISTGDYLNYKQGGGQPWSNDATLGASGNTIAKNGCAVVSSAIMLNDMRVTKDNPGEVNKKFASVMNAGNMMQFEKIEVAYKTEIPNGLVYARKDQRCDLNTQDGLKQAVDIIKAAKDAGKYVILQLDYKNNTNGDHFVYCTGVDSGKIKIADPGYNVDTLPDGYSGKERCVIVSFRIFERK